MPIYEYRCEKCGNVFEKLSGYISTNNEKNVCTKCGNIAERIFSVPNFKFIGNGFYINDYKNKA